MKGTAHLNLGEKAEKIAANYLIAQGYEILEANYFNRKGYRLGEIDLVARDRKGRIIFVEVKARRGRKDQVVPEENITKSKIRKIEKAAWSYLQKKNWLEKDWRIESVGIIFDFRVRRLYLRHIRNIRL